MAKALAVTIWSYANIKAGDVIQEGKGQGEEPFLKECPSKVQRSPFVFYKKTKSFSRAWYFTRPVSSCYNHSSHS